MLSGDNNSCDQTRNTTNKKANDMCIGWLNQKTQNTRKYYSKILQLMKIILSITNICINTQRICALNTPPIPICISTHHSYELLLAIGMTLLLSSHSHRFFTYIHNTFTERWLVLCFCSSFLCCWCWSYI